MDGENNGKPLIKMDDLGGKPTIFGNIRMGAKLNGGFEYCLIYFPEPWGNDSQVDEHMFQMGWFNHQLDI